MWTISVRKTSEELSMSRDDLRTSQSPDEIKNKLKEYSMKRRKRPPNLSITKTPKLLPHQNPNLARCSRNQHRARTNVKPDYIPNVLKQKGMEKKAQPTTRRGDANIQWFLVISVTSAFLIYILFTLYECYATGNAEWLITDIPPFFFLKDCFKKIMKLYF